ncbi:MAG: protein kinase domain-containing protein [Vicinamibacterales bacterium]
MSLAPGTRLGPYEIQSALGAGGMGEVYRARDTRLDRTVAIKVLPSHVATDPTLKQRFEREARTLAALSHPHICPVFDVGQEDPSTGSGQAVDYLVMEYLDGQTLADRLVRGPLPLDQALRYAIEIADALDKAHRKGIVHRDLKPGNIMLTRSGGPSGPTITKLLDFGLAKTAAPAAAGAGASMLPTASPGLTGQGTILGTLQYMAPEQLEGKDADARTDIFAFGAVLYETITGRRAFEGPSQARLISAIMSADPRPLSASQPLAPPPLDHLVQRCLAKDPDERWQTASDVMQELRWLAGQSAQPVTSAPVRTKSHRARIAQAVAALILVAAAFSAGTWWTGARDASPAQWRGERLGGSTVAMGPRISPDGQRLAFQAMVDGLTQVAVMTPQSGDWTVLTRDRSRGGIGAIGWSQDGTRLFFDRFRDGPRGIFTVPVLGGEERIVLEDAIGPELLSDGSLLVTRINADRVFQLHRFWPETGRLEPLPALLSASVLYAAVRVFPDGREAVFFGRPLEGTQTADHLHVIDLTSGRVRRIVPAISISPASWLFPLAVTQDGDWVLFDLAAGNLHRIVAVPRDGSAQVRPIVTLTETPLWLDMGLDGSLYVDQVDQPPALLRFTPASGALDRIPLPNGVGTNGLVWTLPLPDGRVLLTLRIVGRDRVMVMAPGRDPVLFIATEEETTGPLAMVGEDTFVFVTGTVPNRRLALASVADGRITRRLARVDANAIQGLAGSPDGTTIFYVDAGTVWAVPAGDGEPRKIRGGNGVAVDPRGRDLLITLNEPAGVRLIRMPISGGSEEVVPLPSELRPAPAALSGNAIGRDGRVALRVAPIDSWFWPAAIFDPATGRVQRISGDQIDMVSAGWAHDGRLITVAQGVQSSLWRFRPENEAR